MKSEPLPLIIAIFLTVLFPLTTLTNGIFNFSLIEITKSSNIIGSSNFTNLPIPSLSFLEFLFFSSNIPPLKPSILTIVSFNPSSAESNLYDLNKALYHFLLIQLSFFLL